VEVSLRDKIEWYERLLRQQTDTRMRQALTDLIAEEKLKQDAGRTIAASSASARGLASPPDRRPVSAGYLA
jgi:hypothetical protein